MVETVPIVATLVISLLTITSTLLYSPIHEKATILGYLRPRHNIENIYGSNSTVFPSASIASSSQSNKAQKPLLDAGGGGLYIIPGTPLCEDLHLHHGSGLLFTACQVGSYAATQAERHAWFPPLAHFDDPKAVGKGKLVVIDPHTFKAQDLRIDNFDGQPWTTHGIDVVDSSSEENTVYIFAVNHLPNPDYSASDDKARTAVPKARSQIEVFKHVLHTTTAAHIRSIRNPLIATPNDIYALSEKSLYVTNDHHYRDGGLRRFAEDAIASTKWSNIMHIDITDSSTSNPAAGVVVSVALDNLHNPNGLGHPGPERNGKEIVYTSAAGGVLSRAQIDSLKEGSTTSTTLTKLEDIQIMSSLDNPSYYTDPYASPHSNASGYVLAGLVRAADLAQDFPSGGPVPSLVWHVRSNNEDDESHAKWERNLVFQDRGSRMKTATTAVMVSRDLKETGGVKKAWLFVTGFVSEGVGVVGLDL